MKEFYMTQSIPLNFPEEVKEEAIKYMKTKLPNNASIRHEGYMSMRQDTFAIIYTTGE